MQHRDASAAAERRRRLRRAAAVAAVAVASLSGVLAVQAVQARTALERVRGDLPRLQAALLAEDPAEGRRLLADVQARAAATAGSTSTVLWRAVARLPVLGRTPAAVTRLARTTDAVLVDVVPPLLDAGALLRAERLRPAADTVDVAAFTEARPHVAAAERGVRGLLPRGDPPRHVLPAVARAEAQATAVLRRLHTALVRAGLALDALPDALGASGRRRYFVAFQGEAEARGTGGLVGAFGILSADAGRVSISSLTDDRGLRDLPGPVVDLGADFRALYGRDPEIWSGTNLSPHFPYAARLWLDKWRAQTGQVLDGVLAVDPTALGEVLQASGAVTLPDGEVVVGERVAGLVEREAYQRFAHDDAARKEYLVAVAQAAVQQLLSEHGSTSGLLAALATAAGEGRLLAYSGHATARRALAGTRVAGEVPATASPYAAVVVNNAAGNKLDAYLQRSVTYRLGRCRAGSRTTTVRVLLHNDVPPGRLPDYVSGRHDLEVPWAWQRGSNKLHLALYATAGAEPVGVTVGGVEAALRGGRERGHPVLLVPVVLPRGAQVEVVFRLREPAAAGRPRVPEQPLVLAQRTEVLDAGCSPAEVSRSVG